MKSTSTTAFWCVFVNMFVLNEKCTQVDNMSISLSCVYVICLVAKVVWKELVRFEDSAQDVSSLFLQKFQQRIQHFPCFYFLYRRSKKIHISAKKSDRNGSNDIGSSINYFSLVCFHFSFSLLLGHFQPNIVFQFRFATKWDIIFIVIGIIFTIVKSIAMSTIIIIYGEFTTLLVDRTLGVGTSSSTTFLHYFGGGKILYVDFCFLF